jgi:hypothetical protein
MSITTVIKQRLQLPTNKALLFEKFGLAPSLDKITNPAFVKKLRSWDIDKKRKFYDLVGGRVNLKVTENYFETL